MLSTVTVYGSSDDLIEIEGDLREEFIYDEHYPNYLAFSNGLLVKVVYDDDGEWTFRSLNKPVGVTLHTDEPNREADEYSQVMKIESDTYIDWVLHGRSLVR